LETTVLLSLTLLIPLSGIAQIKINLPIVGPTPSPSPQTSGNARVTDVYRPAAAAAADTLKMGDFYTRSPSTIKSLRHRS
jgi:hypothetical protein